MDAETSSPFLHRRVTEVYVFSGSEARRNPTRIAW